MATASTALKRELMEKIGFLEWVVIPVSELLAHFGPGSLFEELEGEVALSPDVNDLHIVWKYRDDDDIYHEMVDYFKYETLEELLDSEVGDDSWEVISGKLFEQVIDDGLGDVKEMSLADFLKQAA